MHNDKFRLVFEVNVRLKGERPDQITRRLELIASNAVNEGMVTGDSPASVESHSFKAEHVVPKIPAAAWAPGTKLKRIRRKAGEHRWKEVDGVTRCVTCFCDEDDAFQGGEECTYGRKATDDVTYYEVKVRVWNVGAFALKKGDAVLVTSFNSPKGKCDAFNLHFGKNIQVDIDDLNVHCKKVTKE